MRLLRSPILFRAKNRDIKAKKFLPARKDLYRLEGQKNMTLKICYVIPDAFICGGNRIVAIHCNKLAERGYDVSIALVNPYKHKTDWLEEIAGKGVKIFGLYSNATELKNLNVIVATYFKTVFNIKEIESKLPDSCEKYYFVQQLENRMVDALFDKCAALYTYSLKDFRIFTEARWIQRELARLGRDSALIPNAQELPADVKTIKRPSKPVVLIEGNLAWRKGVLEGLEALDGIDCAKWLLTNSHEKSCAGLGFDKVFSRVPWKDALSVIKTADVLLKPSYLEGSPTPHMEAIGLGTALVSTNCSGVSEYCVDEYNCLLAEVGDVDEMNSKVRRVLFDDELRERLVANGLKTAKSFSSWKPSIDKLVRLFDWQNGFIKQLLGGD